DRALLQSLGRWLVAFGCAVLLCLSCGVFRFFFFQAEDGIRDWSVTGVQTCALPIFHSSGECCEPSPVEWRADRTRGARKSAGPRSEERRVGKECRSRWSAYH